MVRDFRSQETIFIPCVGQTENLLVVDWSFNNNNNNNNSNNSNDAMYQCLRQQDSIRLKKIAFNYVSP